MYVINLSYHRPMEEVEALTPAHIDWVKRYFEAGVFLAAGRKDPRNGGMIRRKISIAIVWIPFSAKIRSWRWRSTK